MINRSGMVVLACAAVVFVSCSALDVTESAEFKELEEERDALATQVDDLNRALERAAEEANNAEDAGAEAVKEAVAAAMEDAELSASVRVEAIREAAYNTASNLGAGEGSWPTGMLEALQADCADGPGQCACMAERTASELGFAGYLLLEIDYEIASSNDKLGADGLPTAYVFSESQEFAEGVQLIEEECANAEGTATPWSVFDLRVGMCFNDPTGIADVETVDRVDCAFPHDNEVFHLFDMPAGDWPGQDVIETASADGCLAAFDSYVGLEYEFSILDIFPLYPTEASWAEGDREIVCALYHIDLEKLIGSMRDSGV